MNHDGTNSPPDVARPKRRPTVAVNAGVERTDGPARHLLLLRQRVEESVGGDLPILIYQPQHAPLCRVLVIINRRGGQRVLREADCRQRAREAEEKKTVGVHAASLPFPCWPSEAGSRSMDEFVAAGSQRQRRT